MYLKPGRNTRQKLLKINMHTLWGGARLVLHPHVAYKRDNPPLHPPIHLRLCLFVHLSTINLDEPETNSVAWYW